MMVHNKPLYDMKEKQKVDENGWHMVKVEDVLLHLEGLKEDMDDFYHRIGKPLIWSASNDEVADLCEEHAKRLVDERIKKIKQGGVKNE